MYRWKKIVLWLVGVMVVAYIALVIARIPAAEERYKTAEQVAKIHATKLTLDDVMGKRFPPDPGAAVDTTVAGVDANRNGIRDDVEIAIFKAYPNSAKTRAVLLQYALALQMEAVQKVVNTETVTAVVESEERANTCIADTLVPRKSPESGRSYSDLEKINSFTNFVESRQVNTELRKKDQHGFYENLGSHSVPKESCDLNVSSF